MCATSRARQDQMNDAVRGGGGQLPAGEATPSYDSLYSPLGSISQTVCKGGRVGWQTCCDEAVTSAVLTMLHCKLNCWGGALASLAWYYNMLHIKCGELSSVSRQSRSHFNTNQFSAIRKEVGVRTRGSGEIRRQRRGGERPRSMEEQIEKEMGQGMKRH